VAAIGAGGYFGQKVLSWVDYANGLSPSGKEYASRLADARDQAQTQALMANSLFIGGGTLVATGTLWWLLQPSTSSRVVLDPEVRHRPAWRPVTVASDGRSLLLAWSF
jgi:hypothetical protein